MIKQGQITMETIHDIELRDESVYPDEHVLKSILGKSYHAYCQLLKLYDDNQLKYEWKYYRDGKAWLCKVQRNKKTIVWMSAWKGYMQAIVYFSDKCINDVYTLDMREQTKERIRQTTNVGRLKPCIFQIRNMGVLKDFYKIMHCKMITST
jgi:hypothetical protein